MQEETGKANNKQADTRRAKKSKKSKKIRQKNKGEASRAKRLAEAIICKKRQGRPR